MAKDPNIPIYDIVQCTPRWWHLHCQTCGHDFRIARGLSEPEAREALLLHSSSHDPQTRKEDSNG